MFGFYRTILAISVMAFHLLGIPVIGTYAVFSFFVLSGFLMTTIMHETYGYDLQGIKRYAANRFFRLYPMYWAAALFSIAVILIASSAYAYAYKDTMQIPHRISSIVFNLTMIFPARFPYTVDPRLSPPTWALTVEIFFYICIGLGLSRTRNRTFGWLGASLVYLAWSYIDGQGESYRYANIPAASLPFALGALLYFVKGDVQRRLGVGTAISPAAVLGALASNAALFAVYSMRHKVNSSPFVVDTGKYLNLVLSAVAVVVLFHRGHEFCSKAVDKWFGDFSYPIYLSHWQAGLMASYFLFPKPTFGMNKPGAQVFLLALLIVFAWSYASIALIDRRVNQIRNKIRPKVPRT
ncbi:MAG: acyltransferase, partial [Burkholderiales bacterium]|nr:acyltransferase [Burkholderiales bacterium]MDE1925768.1 acyltransferase [Burkholderiales bacterium]MDE2158008.1 acyltransferase [Burkholderiales bacterium]